MEEAPPTYQDSSINPTVFSVPQQQPMYFVPHPQMQMGGAQHYIPVLIAPTGSSPNQQVLQPTYYIPPSNDPNGQQLLYPMTMSVPLPVHTQPPEAIPLNRSANTLGSVHHTEANEEESSIKNSTELSFDTNKVVPYDWEMKLKDGKKFYIDHITKTSHWPPPSGWIIRKTDAGKVYYIHLETKSSHWRLPPSGWSVKKHSDGKIFFIDHNTKTTHWKLPSIESKPSNLKKSNPKDDSSDEEEKPAPRKPVVVTIRGSGGVVVSSGKSPVTTTKNKAKVVRIR